MTVAPETVTVVIPGAHLMGSLVGERDELLRLVERSFPEMRIQVRGNEITISGAQAELEIGRAHV